MKKEENPNAFKHWINKALLSKMGTAIKQVYPAFDSKKMIALAPQLEPLELKPRVLFIRDHLKTQLPNSFTESLKILLKSLDKGELSGFDLWPYTEFIQTYGLEHPEQSLKALYEITQLFTAEFAVRPFLKKHPELTLAFLEKCSTDKNVHIRRWASEGSRSRLPWGERLDSFIKDHRPTLKILENLKFDSELYVRKSISNHLNDMAKDHPDLVIKTLKKWKSESGDEHLEKVNWIIHRALRTLIKQGHPQALQLVGANQDIKIKVSPLKIKKSNIKMNERLEFSFEVKSSSDKPQKLVIDYIIHFVKANGKTAGKVFKLKNFTLKPNEKIVLTKKHHIKPITTRVFYPGVHDLQIQINGVGYKKEKWNLKTTKG